MQTLHKRDHVSHGQLALRGLLDHRPDYHFRIRHEITKHVQNGGSAIELADKYGVGNVLRRKGYTSYPTEADVAYESRLAERRRKAEAAEEERRHRAFMSDLWILENYGTLPRF